MRCEEQGNENFPAVSLSRDVASVCETLMREMLKGSALGRRGSGGCRSFVYAEGPDEAGRRGFIANGREFSLKSAGNCSDYCDPLASHHFADASSTIQGFVSAASFI